MLQWILFLIFKNFLNNFYFLFFIIFFSWRKSGSFAGSSVVDEPFPSPAPPKALPPQRSVAPASILGGQGCIAIAIDIQICRLSA